MKQYKMCETLKLQVDCFTEITGVMFHGRFHKMFHKMFHGFLFSTLFMFHVKLLKKHC